MRQCFTRGPTGVILTGSPVGDASDHVRGFPPLEIELRSVAVHDSLCEVATQCSGRRPTAGVLCDSISPSGSSFARIPAKLRPPFSNTEASLRHASVLSRSSSEIRFSDDVPDHRTILIQKVLRFWQSGRSSSPHQIGRAHV